MDIDNSVVGHWRNTDSMDGGGISVVTDTHYELDNNGRFEHWVKSRSAGFDQGDSLKTYGKWETRDGRLYITFDSGEAFSTAYKVQGETLFLPDEPRLRIWHRVDKQVQWI